MSDAVSCLAKQERVKECLALITESSAGRRYYNMTNLKINACKVTKMHFSMFIIKKNPKRQMHVSLFSWQNQLLAKGLLFMEEKVKLCEGKHSRKPILEGSCALMFGQTG